MRSSNSKTKAMDGGNPAAGSGLAFVGGAAAIALILLVYYRFAWGSFGQFLRVIDVWDEPFADLQRYYYPMGQAILGGGGRVDGFVYSPFSALMMAPVALLPPAIAVDMWGVLLAGAMVVYFWLFRRLVPASMPLQLMFVALALSSFPVLHTVKFGQMTLFATVALLATLVVAERGPRWAGAALLAFATSFKWHPAIFLAPFVARRDTRLVAWTLIAGVVLLLAAPAILLGIARTLQFYDGLRATYMHFDWVLDSYNTQYFPNVILRIGHAGGIRLHPLLVERLRVLLGGLGWCVVAANLILVYLIERARLRHADLWSFQVLFLNVPFLLGTSWPVDLVYLPFAQAVLAWALLDNNGTPTAEESPPSRDQARPGRRKTGLKGAVPAGLLTIVSVALSNIVVFNLISDRTLYGTLGLVFWSSLFALIASYIVLLPAVRHPRGHPATA